MVKHIVLWDFEKSLDDAQRREAAVRMKELLEPIREKVPGAIAIEVIQNEQASSNRDIALISEFESIEALAAYQIHPDHVEAGKYVRSVTCNRACMDYEL